MSGRSFFARDVTSAGAGVITEEIRSSLRRLVITQDPNFAGEEFYRVDKTKNLVLFADVVVLQGNFVMEPGRSFMIAARVIETHGGLPSTVAVDGRVDTSTPREGQPVPAAKDGQNGAFRPSDALCTHHDSPTPGDPGTPGNKGDDGVDGGKAGTITLLAHTLRGPIHLRANGGAGTDGAKGGPGGQGGQGGYGNYSNWLGLFGAAHPTMGQVDVIEPGQGGKGGDGGKGGKGGNGGDGGSIVVHVMTAAPENLTWEVKGGAAGRNGESGEPGSGGYTPELKNREIPGKRPQLERRQAASGGRQVQDATPTAGKDGSSNVRVVTANDFLNHVDPVQLEMMLQKIFAGLVVAGLDTTKTPPIVEPLQWIEAVLAPMLEESTRSRLPAERVKLFERLYSRVTIMLGRLATGVDAFGHEKTYAPSPSLGTFEESLSTNLEAFKVLETEYKEFLEQLAKRQDIRASSTVIINQAEADKRAAENLKAKALEQLKRLQPEIDSARKECAELRSTARDMQHDLMQVINMKFNFTDVNALLTAVEMICFVPPTSAAGAAMSIGQIGKLLHNGMTTISRDDGGVEPKDKVIENLQRLEGAVDAAANAAASTYRDGDETTKLLLSLEQYQGAVEKFRSLQGVPGILALIAKMLEKFRRKNTLLLEYNEHLRTYRAMQARLSECLDTIAIAGTNISKVSDPSFPLMASFLGLLHDRMKTEIIEKLELANRAYAFYTLDTSYRVFPDVLASKDFSDPDLLGSIDSAILTACVQRLRNRLHDKLSESNNEPQPFDGYVLSISDPAILQELKDSHKTWFLLERAASGERSFSVPGWTAATDVRLTEVCIYLRGATLKTRDGHTGPGVISVGLTHNAFDTIYRTETQAATFTHATNARYLFAYEPAKGDQAGIVTRATISCDVVSPRPDKRAYYAGAGPFTSWDVDLKTSANPDLLLDGLTQIDIHFKGHLRPQLMQAVSSNQAVESRMFSEPTPSKDAVRFVQLLNDDPLIASAFHLAIGQAVAESDPDAAMRQWLQARGFITTLMEVISAMEDAHQNDLAVWRGTYALTSGDGKAYQLNVRSRTSVSLDDKVLSGISFKNRTLTWNATAEQGSAGTIAFELSPGALEADAKTARLVSLAASGTITQGAEASRSVQGHTPRLLLGGTDPVQPAPKPAVNSLVPFNGSYAVKIYTGGKAEDAANFVMVLDADNKGTVGFGFELAAGSWSRNGDDSLMWDDSKGHGTKGAIVFKVVNLKKRFEGRIWSGETQPGYANAIGTFIEPEHPLKNPEVVVSTPFAQTGLAFLGALLLSAGTAAFPALWKRLQEWREKRREAAERGESLAHFDAELRQMRPALEHHTARQREILRLLEQQTLEQFVHNSERLEKLETSLERELDAMQEALQEVNRQHEQAEVRKGEAMLEEALKQVALQTAEDLYQEAKRDFDRDQTEENREQAEQRAQERDQATRDYKTAQEETRRERERSEGIRDHHEQLRERHGNMSQARDLLRHR